MRKHLFWILLSFGFSFLVAALIAPDLFLFRHISFMAAHDSESPFHNTFALINQWANGGFGIYNRFDQSSLAFAHTTSGVYTVSNVITAFLYMLFAPFLSSQSEGYQSVYILGFHGVNMLLRTVGGYLLLSRYDLHKGVMVVSLVVLNTLLSLAIYQGLLTNNLYSYFPLILFFILGFADKGKLEDLLAAIVVFSIAVANSAIIALGYFYEPVHFFILSALAWAILTKRHQHWNIVRQLKEKKLKVAAALAVSALIVLPSVWMAKLMGSDFFVAGSGAGGTHGRLEGIFNRFLYFLQSQPNMYKPSRFFMESLNFLDNRWEGTYVFIGFGVFLLTLTALIFSRHQVKWVFLATIILVIFSNMPLDPWSVFSFAHWINVISNPFSFLLHSFGMPAYLMLFAFMPLVAFGLQVIVDIPNQVWRKYLLMAIGALLVFDHAAAFIYVKQYHNKDMIISPRIRYPLAGMTPIIVEYQNPLNLPFPENIHADPIPVGMPVLNSNQNVVGLFYKYVDLERYALVEPSLYNPLPISYKDMYDDKDGPDRSFVQYYVRQDARWARTVPVGIPADAMPRMNWFAMHLDQRVALLDGADGQTPGITQNPQEVLSRPQPALPPRASTAEFDLSKARKMKGEKFDIYAFDLPKEFPDYMASTVFTKDAQDLQVKLGNVALTGVQGKITQAMSFDINNIHRGELRLSLPHDAPAALPKVVLSWQRSGEIIDYWKNTHDKIGFTYQAPHDGWLLLHMPYDAKWRLSIDGKNAAISKANKYFLATPIVQGSHQVLLEYWPNNLLIPMLILSIVLIFLSLIVVVRFGLR